MITMILGPAGSGKTTILQNYAKSLEQGTKIVLYTMHYDYESWEEILSNFPGSQRIENDQELLQYRNSLEPCTILIDNREISFRLIFGGHYIPSFIRIYFTTTAWYSFRQHIEEVVLCHRLWSVRKMYEVKSHEYSMGSSSRSFQEKYEERMRNDRKMLIVSHVQLSREKSGLKRVFEKFAKRCFNVEKRLEQYISSFLG